MLLTIRDASGVGSRYTPAYYHRYGDLADTIEPHARLR